MRTQLVRLLAAATLLGLGATPVRAQNTVDSRWLAYLGCWEALGTPSTLCLIPSADRFAVDLVTIKNGEVMSAEQILPTGARLETARGECTGWRSAEWSAASDRLYLRSEETCPDWGTRTGTGVIALSRDGQLLYIQGSTVGLRAGVRAQRYREVTTNIDVPSEVRDALDALRPDLTASMEARAAATASLAIEDLVDATRQLDAAVVEAWLVERGGGGSFTLDAGRLTALAKAGVPSRITDLMIALSYPKVFAINATSHQGERRVITDESYAGGATYPLTLSYGDCLTTFPPFGYSSNYCDGFSSLYPYGYISFPYNYPVAIIYTGGSNGAGGGGRTSHGRVVNGQGYEEGQRPNADVSTRWGEPRSPVGGWSSNGTSAPSSTSSSSGEQRTAKPRP